MSKNTTQNNFQKSKGILQQNLLVALTLVGVGVGLFVGLMVAPTNLSSSTLLWLGMLGELYVRMIKMMIVPLVVCSIIADNGYNHLFQSWIDMIYLTTVTGLQSDVNVFKRDIMETEDIFADLLRNIFPDNLVASCFEQAQTKYEYGDVKVTVNNGRANITRTDRVVLNKYLGAAKSTNILGLVIVSAIFGVASKAMGEKGEPFLMFFQSSTDIIIRILRVVIWSTPVGVTSLVAKAIAGTGDLHSSFRTLCLYFLTCIAGQLFWALVIMPLVYFYVRRRNPFTFLASIMPSMLIVFATTSSVMAMPESFHALEKKNNIDKRISRFVIPLFASIGRAGSANYIAVSCIFIIQLVAMDVTVTNAFLVIVLTWSSALAIPSVTGASLVTVLILLTALKIPGESAAMLFALEFFLDRARGLVNLITQLTGVVVTQRYCALSMRVEDDIDTLEGMLDEQNAQTENADRDAETI